MYAEIKGALEKEEFKERLETKDKLELPIETRRHSGAHLMAAAIQNLYPGTRFGVGPDIRDGWFYDIRLPDGATLSQEDFKKIEAEMARLKKLNLPFVRMELPIDEAIEYMEKQKQTYKVALLKDLKTKGTTAVADLEDENALGVQDKTGAKTVSFYQVGDFVDLCRGPHVAHSGQVAEFELSQMSSAYWRGDSKNDAMTRIYALSYFTKEEILKRKEDIENSKKSDHRVLGEKHQLFFIEPEMIGPGLPLWEPKGMVLINELKHLAQQMERRYGYEEVRTPELAYQTLFEKSGHLAHYKDDMFPAMKMKEGEKDIYLKPMSCPFHHAIYSAHGTPSYQSLPKRFKEWGNVHRYESSGSLTGLLRVRAITQDDSHIYATPDQVTDELINVMRLSEEYYRLFGFKNYRIVFALPDFDKKPEKYMKDEEGWSNAISYMRKAIEKVKIPYTDAKGEAAFYGPKFDFVATDEVTGKEFAISTIQLDFGATKKFDLNFIGKDGQKHPLFVIHRAPLGSLERMSATLIKHYAGKFPVWLAPEQVRILTVNGSDDALNLYANKIQQWLQSQKVNNGTSGFRVSMDISNSTIGKKVREGQQDQVPYMIVLGLKEMASNTISIRTRDGKVFNGLDPDKFLERLKSEAEDRVDLSSLSMEKPIPPQKPLTFMDALKPKASVVDIRIDSVSRADLSL